MSLSISVISAVPASATVTLDPGPTPAMSFTSDAVVSVPVEWPNRTIGGKFVFGFVNKVNPADSTTWLYVTAPSKCASPWNPIYSNFGYTGPCLDLTVQLIHGGITTDLPVTSSEKWSDGYLVKTSRALDPTWQGAVAGDRVKVTFQSGAFNMPDPSTGYEPYIRWDWNQVVAQTGKPYGSNGIHTTGTGTAALEAAVAPSAPSAPGTPIATAGLAQATLTFAASATGSAPITYTVTSNPAGGTCTVSSLTATCTGLTNGTDYTFTVTATNATGSATSASSNTVRPLASPSAPDVSLGILDSGIHVGVADSGYGGPPASYRATASPGGAYCDVIPPATTCDITGLTNDTEYTVSVVATNVGGSSIATTGTQTPRQAPSAVVSPLASLDGNLATISWAAASGGGAPYSYLVTASPGGSTCATPPPATTCQIPDLNYDTEYTFSIVALNAAGTSTPVVSNAVTPVRPTGNGGTGASYAIYKPATPKQSEFTLTHDKSSISVFANYSGIDSASPDKYLVTVAPGGKTCLIPTPFSSCTVDGLNPNIEYTVSISAVNNLGKSLLTWPFKFILSTTGANQFVAQSAITNFAGDSAKLTAKFKGQIAAFVNAHNTLKSFTCTGYIAGASKSKASKGLAKARAKAVCSYIKSIVPDAITTVIASTPSAKFNVKNRKVVIRAFSATI